MNQYYRSHWERFYDHVAPGYDRKVMVFALLLGGRERFYRRCATLLALEPTATLLDVGCGTGSLTVALARLAVPFGSVLGIDISGQMIGVACSKATSRVSFRQLDALHTDLPDSQFDAAAVVAVLHELPYDDRRQLLSETRRVLKPGGTLLIGEHHASGRFPISLFQRAVFRLISKKPERATFADLAHRGVQAEAADAGFQPRAAVVLPLALFELMVAVRPTAAQRDLVADGTG